MSTAQAQTAAAQGIAMTKITMNLPARTVEGVKWLAGKFGISNTQVVRQSIDLRVELQREVDEGARVLIERDGAVRQIIFN